MSMDRKRRVLDYIKKKEVDEICGKITYPIAKR